MTRTAEKQRRSLAEFAKAHPAANQKAWIETIPEFDEVVAVWKKGVPGSVIIRWLREECGYTDATPGRVSDWLRDHVTRTDETAGRF